MSLQTLDQMASAAKTAGSTFCDEIDDFMSDIDDELAREELRLLAEAPTVIKEAIERMNEALEPDCPEWEDFPEMEDVEGFSAMASWGGTTNIVQLTAKGKVDGMERWVFWQQWSDFGTYWDPPDGDEILMLDAVDKQIVLSQGNYVGEDSWFWDGDWWDVTKAEPYATMMDL